MALQKFNVMRYGKAYNGLECRVSLLNGTIAGLSSIAYATNQAKADVYGAGGVALARTVEPKQHTGSLTVMMEEYQQIADAAESAGYNRDLTDVPPFTITVVYQPDKNNPDKIATDYLKNVEFTGVDRTVNGQTGDAQMIELGLVVGDVEYR
jgi:hypothetical protein